MSNFRPDDVTLDGETRKISPAEPAPEASEFKLDALTLEVDTKKIVDPDDITVALIDEDLENEKPKPDPKAERKATLEKAQELVGQVISDRYEVEEVLAAGGMGCVYRGRHVHMHKRVAIKVLLPDTKGLPELVTRFKREAVAGAHIDHPNVAAATDFGTLEGGAFFLVLQYVRGATLHEIIKQGPVPAARAARIVRQIAAALDACHRMGVIHRDLKPRNIMVEEERNDAVKLIDFGLAKVPMDRIATIDIKAATKHLKVTTMGVVFGTVAYMAPEAALGMDAVDERSDLYALGVILYEMLAGKHPFEATRPPEMFKMHRSKTPPPIQVRSPGVEVPPALEAIAMRLLQKEAPMRYESAQAVISALDAAMPSAASDLPVASSGPANLPPITSAPPLPPPANEYVPRLAGRSTLVSAKTKEIPRWVLPGALTLALVAVIAAGVIVVRGSKSDARAGGSKALRAERALSTAGEAASNAAQLGKKAPEPTVDPEAIALRSRMRASTESKEWSRGALALVALADLEPRAFEERDIALTAIAITTAMERGGDDKNDKVFDALTNKLGRVGLDILYEIESTRGGSKAAARAAEILRKPEVFERASPGLKVAIELRDGSCQKRLTLLERARKEGDSRAVAVLDIARLQQCMAGAGECCFRTNPAIDDTIKQIWARLRTSR